MEYVTIVTVGDNAKLSPAEPQVLFGGYRLLRRLAVGGMAEVFLARQEGETSGEFLVLKRLLPHISNQPEMVQMFLDEARVATTLDHENIVKIHNVGAVGDQYFLSMEYLRGLDLTKICSRLWRSSRTLPLNLSIYVTWSIAKALAYAYETRGTDGKPLRLVHRDVSPHNIFVTAEGEAKLLDFGVAKARNALHHTKTGAIVGKVGYMSPEQCRSEPLDCRSDLFSLGIVFYEFLTGGRLFSVKKLGDLGVLRKICSGSVARPSEAGKFECPEQVEEVVLRMLAKTPDDRYANAKEVVEELERCASALSIEISPGAMREFIQAEFSDVLDEEARRVRTLSDTYRIAAGSMASGVQFASGSNIDEDEDAFPDEERTKRRVLPSAGSGSRKFRQLAEESSPSTPSREMQAASAALPASQTATPRPVTAGPVISRNEGPNASKSRVLLLSGIVVTVLLLVAVLLLTL